MWPSPSPTDYPGETAHSFSREKLCSATHRHPNHPEVLDWLRRWLGRELNPRVDPLPGYCTGHHFLVSRSLTFFALLHHATFMASPYVRTSSPFYWIRFQKPDGTWGGKSSGIRRTADGSLRKVKQAVAQETMREHTFSERTQSNRFDAWVPTFLSRKYANEKTLIRYQAGWSAISTFLWHRNVIAPAQVTYQLCTEYPAFRTHPPKELMKARSHNTALTELKVFSAIMQEAVRRGYVPANPAIRLGLRRHAAKQKPEITAAEQATIEEALKSRDGWMRDCWLVAMLRRCRF